MNIWRLIAHHDNSEEAIALMKAQSRVAIGWSEVGDLKVLNPADASKISDEISSAYPSIQNSHLGGPSLWNFYSEVREGDFVIVNANGKRQCVFEINGPYIFESGQGILGYNHQRFASLTNLDPDVFWKSAGSAVAEGQNQRWTFVACSTDAGAKNEIHKEGARYSVTSTAIERNPASREKCIQYYGAVCMACGFDFESTYGKIGKGYIHVHHRIDLALQKGVHTVDPVKDLIPLCPNCHAMIHKETPAMEVEELKSVLRKNKNA